YSRPPGRAGRPAATLRRDGRYAFRRVTTPSATSCGPAEELRRRIAQHGPIGFDEFMAVALYHSQGGYYAAETNRTGRRGDFFTSVSVGPVFGKLLAAQFMEMRQLLGDPEDFTLVEQGANDGQLLADILASWEGPQPRVIIVEPLEQRRAAQRKTLEPWLDRVQHVAREEELPDFTGVFFANELLDAFPVRLLVRDDGRWFERRVDSEDGRFVFVDAPFTGEAPTVAEDVPPFATEICPSLAPWMQTVAGKLTRGWIFLIDYGHPADVRHHAWRAAGSLAAYRGHQRVDNPLNDPGSQDLTAHVDFTAVARVAESAGLQLAGFTDQHHALTALAAKAFLSMPEEKLSADAAREMRALRQLLHPESMGTSFKFLALAKGCGAPLGAFAFARDPRRELFA
ncbi:MAG: class I SAM-dependent methyltransferase, partial [Sphaerospermopsis kisseleviana]